MALGLDIERTDAVDALRYAQGDVEAAANNLCASNEAQAGHRTRLAAQREAEAAQEQIRRADEAKRRADDAERSANYDRQLAEVRERNAAEDVARRADEAERTENLLAGIRERRAAEDVARQADQQERQDRRAAEDAQRARDREADRQRAEADRQRRAAEYDVDRQRRAAEMAATRARQEEQEQARLRESEAKLAQARQQEDSGRGVRDLAAQPRMHADRLAAHFNCRADVAARAVQAAIKIKGDINEAANLLYEPEEVEMILAYQNVRLQHTCKYCNRSFRTMAAYQNHNSTRLMNKKCPTDQPNQTFLGGLTDTFNSAYQATTDFFAGPARQSVVTTCPNAMCQRSVTVTAPGPGVEPIYTCPHCFVKMRVDIRY